MALDIERRGDVVIWTLNRPEARNALSYATFDELLSAIGDAARDTSLRAVILTGARATFASGGDLRELRDALSSDDAKRLSRGGRSVTRAIGDLGVPVIAVLPGPAVGGGAELAVACDLRIAETPAKIQFKHTRMGVTTAWGGTARLHSLVGPGLAARLLLTGQTLAAAEAHAMGLVDSVVEEGAGVAAALLWARDIAASPKSAVAAQKRLLRRMDTSPTSADDDEKAAFIEAWTAPDHAEAVEAFFERRPPRWSSE